MSVLIVDDCSAAAEALALYLRLFHYDVRVANDTRAAVAMLNDLPDVVIVDLLLPRPSDLWKVLRKVGRVLVAMTNDRNEATEGFDHHFLKGIDPHFLSDLLHTIHNRRGIIHPPVA